MAGKHLKTETVYLREFAKHYTNEIAFDAAAETQMRSEGIWLPEMHHALKTGVVVNSEREDAEGAIWTVVGETCDDDRLIITLEVICNQYHMCVQNIVKVERVPR